MLEVFFVMSAAVASNTVGLFPTVRGSQGRAKGLLSLCVDCEDPLQPLCGELLVPSVWERGSPNKQSEMDFSSATGMMEQGKINKTA